MISNNRVNKKSLVPLQHHILGDHWRVPVLHNGGEYGGEYEVYVDTNYARIFTDTTLPPCIKAKIPFARASGKYSITPDILETYSVYGRLLDLAEIYYCPPHMKELENTAWQVIDGLDIIVLHDRDMVLLQGKTLNNDTEKETKNDTGSESKKGGKKGTGRIKLLSFFPTDWRFW